MTPESFHTADVNISSEPAAAGQRDDRAPLEIRETSGDRGRRMQVANVKALPAAFFLGDVYPPKETWWHPSQVWSQYIRPLKEHLWKSLLGSLKAWNTGFD